MLSLGGRRLSGRGEGVRCPKERADPISLQVAPDCTELSPTGWSPWVCAMGRMVVFFQIMCYRGPGAVPEGGGAGVPRPRSPAHPMLSLGSDLLLGGEGPGKGPRPVPPLSLSILTPVGNSQHRLAGKAFADGLLEQLVCLLVHTCGGLIDAQDLDRLEQGGEGREDCNLPTVPHPQLLPEPSLQPPSSLLGVPSSCLTLASVRRALARHSSCLCPSDRFRPLSPSSPSRPPGGRTSPLPRAALCLSPALQARARHSPTATMASLR